MADPAPIIVTALFGGEDQAAFDRLRTTYFPPERNYLAAHLTMFHHLPPAILPELKQRLTAATRGVPPPLAEAAGLLNLGRGVAVRIVSEELAAVRADLAEAFAPLLMPQDRAGWRPHVTVQNKVTPAEARATLAALQAVSTAPGPDRRAGHVVLSRWAVGGDFAAHVRVICGRRRRVDRVASTNHRPRSKPVGRSSSVG